MNYRIGTVAEAELLAEMNEMLIRDEGHRNPMNQSQLTQRMQTWLQVEYQAVLFQDGHKSIGYVLFRHDADYVYVRQLFVVAEKRRQGIGSAAISCLRENVWAGAPRLRIDVLIHNQAARLFWLSVGFRDYCITMESDI